MVVNFLAFDSVAKMTRRLFSFLHDPMGPLEQENSSQPCMTAGASEKNEFHFLG